MKKVLHESAYVLHQYPFSESSLILEVFTRHYGRVALVAKGVKRPSSQFRSVLLPLQKLSVSYSGDAEVRTLKSAEWTGGHTMPSGDALLSGYYINELVMKLLARDDPHDRLFDAYAQMVAWLRDAAGLDAALRAFELVLLRDVGLLPALDRASLSQSGLDEALHYRLVPEIGLRETADDGAGGDDGGGAHGGHAHAANEALTGAEWQAVQTQLDRSEPMPALRQLCAALPAASRAALKAQLRALLQYHAGGKGLRTRQMMRDLQTLSG
jgi:DNA repair protein RecO (recombination protein O)